MSHVGKGDIHAYLDGALGAYPEGEANRVRQHLDECEACARSLDEERELRMVASEILAATAEAPMDLAPFEELVARADEAESTRPSGGTSKFRVLRMAATVVISLGAGWIAHDLTGPGSELATAPALDAVRTQEGVPSRADEALNPFQAEPELRQADQGDFTAQVASPVQSQDLDAEAVPPIARAALSDVVIAPTDAPAAAVPMESADEVEAGRRDAVGGALRLDQQRASEAAPQAAGPAAPLERRRREAVDPTSVMDNRAVTGVARGVAASVLAEDVTKSNQDELFADNANAMSLNEMSVTGRTSSFVIPGLSIRDVRFGGGAEGFDSAVTIIQELPDGRVVELRFVPTLAERDTSRDAEGIPVARLPDGWNQVVRELLDGLAILRGPLGEAELSELLDQALARR